MESQGTTDGVTIGLLHLFIGITLISLLLPVLVLIASRFIQSWKRNPKKIYVVCAVLAVIACALLGTLLTATASRAWISAVSSMALAGLFLYWLYRLDVKALAASAPE